MQITIHKLESNGLNVKIVKRDDGPTLIIEGSNPWSTAQMDLMAQVRREFGLTAEQDDKLRDHIENVMVFERLRQVSE